MRKITLMFLISVLLANVPAIAGDITWLGTTSSDFTNVNNWVGGVAPAHSLTGDRAVFPSGATPFQPALAANRSLSGLVFQATSGGWILGSSGRTLSLGAGGIDDTANISGTDTIAANISMEAHQTWSMGNGGLSINGTGTIAFANLTLTVASGIATLATLDGTSGRNLTKTGPGTLAVTGAAGAGQFGTIFVQAGTVVVGNKLALGSGAVIQLGNNITNATLQASADLSGVNKITNNVILANSAYQFIISGSNNIEFGGKVFSQFNSDYNLINNLDSGKTLTINNWNLNETSSAKSVTLGGTGNTTVAGTIANSSTAGAINLILSNTGTTTLNGNNTYFGTTTINAGALRLGNANAVPGGIGISNGSNVLSLAGGVVELEAGDFTRGLGTGATQVKIMAPGGGFSAYGGKRLVNLGGAGAGVTWNSGSFVPTSSALLLNSLAANSEIDFQNPINLAGAARTVQVNDNTATNSDFATLSGVVTNGGLVKTGAGKLVLAGSTNFFASGLTVSNGTLAVNGVTTSSVMTVSGGTALINGAYTGPVTVGSGGALGGTGTLAAANLTLLSNAVISVTILDTLGHSDALTVTGVLSVTNVTLQVINTNLLTIGQTYKVVNGSHSNAFTASNVPANWTIDYANPGFIQLRSGGYSGTMIKIQ